MTLEGPRRLPFDDAETDSGARARRPISEWTADSRVERIVFGLSEYTTWPLSFEADVRLCRDLKIASLEVTEAKLDREGYGEQLALGEPPEPEDRLCAMKASIERLSPHVPDGTPFVVITGAAPGGDAAAAYARARSAFA